MTKLERLYSAATAKLGADLPLALARAFGAVDGVADVPAARRDGLAAALNRVLKGEGHISMALAKAAAHGEPKSKRRGAAVDQDEIFRAIRAEAFGGDEDRDARPPAKLDPAKIYSRWNNPPPVERD